MTHISKRLEAVVGLVTPGGIVADIGCDHAHVAMYLYENSLCEKVIACDANSGPIDAARRNVAEAGLENQISVRLADGLLGISDDAVDSVVIAGMGGNLVISILEKGKSCISDECELILQPQSDIAEVRRYLVHERFSILAEDMVFEDGKYYMMFKAAKVSGAAKRRYMSEADFEFGGLLIDGKHPVLIDYLRFKKNHYADIIKGISQNGGSLNALGKRKSLSEELSLIETTLNSMT